MNWEEVSEKLHEYAMKAIVADYLSLRSKIAEIQGSYAWWFLEHAGELDEEGVRLLLFALVKRRLEKQYPGRHILGSPDLERIELLLAHNNSLHGQRSRQKAHMSLREECFVTGVSVDDYATPRQIGESLKQILRDVEFEEDSRRKLRWKRRSRNIEISGCVEFSGTRRDFASYCGIRRDGDSVYPPISLLQILGIGTTTWNLLLKGEEQLCANHIKWFFEEMFRLLV